MNENIGEKKTKRSILANLGITLLLFSLSAIISRFLETSEKKEVFEPQSKQQEYTQKSNDWRKMQLFLAVVGAVFWVVSPPIDSYLEQRFGLAQLRNNVREAEQILASLESGINLPLLLFSMQNYSRLDELTLTLMRFSTSGSEKLKTKVEELIQLRLKLERGEVTRDEFTSRAGDVREEAKKVERSLKGKIRSYELKLSEKEFYIRLLKRSVGALIVLGLFYTYWRDASIV